MKASGDACTGKSASACAMKAADCEKMLRTYQKHRSGKESFQQFTTRHEVGKLQEMFAE